MKIRCVKCGYLGRPFNKKGSLGLEITLWIVCMLFAPMFILTLPVPIIYSVWRHSNRDLFCPQCGEKLLDDSIKNTVL